MKQSINYPKFAIGEDGTVLNMKTQKVLKKQLTGSGKTYYITVREKGIVVCINITKEHALLYPGIELEYPIVIKTIGKKRKYVPKNPTIERYKKKISAVDSKYLIRSKRIEEKEKIKKEFFTEFKSSDSIDRLWEKIIIERAN